MPYEDRNTPPPTYLENTTPLVLVTESPVPIYSGWFLPGSPYYNADDAVNPWLWHWCVADKMWHGTRTTGWELVQREPLTLRPSVLWHCCGLHGFVTNGDWKNC